MVSFLACSPRAVLVFWIWSITLNFGGHISKYLPTCYLIGQQAVVRFKNLLTVWRHKNTKYLFKFLFYVNRYRRTVFVLSKVLRWRAKVEIWPTECAGLLNNYFTPRAVIDLTCCTRIPVIHEKGGCRGTPIIHYRELIPYIIVVAFKWSRCPSTVLIFLALTRRAIDTAISIIS